MELYKQTLNKNKNKNKKKSGEERRREDEIEVEMDEGTSTSRRESISSCSEDSRISNDRKKEERKRKELKRKRNSSDENNITHGLEEEVNLASIKKSRGELENFSFEENNKVTKAATRYILNKWNEMENKLHTALLEMERTKGKLEEISHAGNKEVSPDGDGFTMSYAGAVKTVPYGRWKNKEGFKKSEAIIIKPVEGNKIETNEKVKEKVIEIMKPRKNSIRIKNIRRIREKGVVIETEDTEDLNIIKEIDFSKAGLKIEHPRKIGPTVLIYNVDKDKTTDEIRNDLWAKNLNKAGIDRNKFDDKIFFRFSTRNKDKNLVNWILEVPGKIYDVLLNKERIYIEWKAHRVKEFLNVTRCYKCLGYGHSAKNCNVESPTCEHCGNDGHIRKDCPKAKDKRICICCKRSKRNKIDHSVRDKNCPEYLRQVERLKSRISYS